MSGSQETNAGSFQGKKCLLIINKVEDLQTEQNNGCETPKALSSITMLEERAAMKMIIQNSLHSRRKTEQARKDCK